MRKEEITRINANRLIAQGALTVMAAFVVSNLVGLLAKTITARHFGTGIESNAFFAANRFSEILFNLVAGGALGSAFIPVFTGMLTKNENQKAWRLASAVANLVSIALICLSLLTMIFSKQVVQYILAPGFEGTDTVQERINLVRNTPKPFILIKTLGAGRIPPSEGLAFIAAHAKPNDLISVGFGTEGEVAESVELAEKLF